MLSLKKILTTTLLLSASSVFAGQQYVIVQCNMNPAAIVAATYSDSDTGKMHSAPSCGEALATVPVAYTLTSHDSSGKNGAGFVNYLFALN